jgi:hypothetical protein
MPFYIKNADHFTKTGSGQNMGTAALKSRVACSSGLRGQLGDWIYSSSKRDPMVPMRRPLRVEGLVVLRAQPPTAAAAQSSSSTAAAASMAGEPEPEPEPVDAGALSLASLHVRLGVELPAGCVVEVDPAHGLRRADTRRALAVLQTAIGTNAHPKVRTANCIIIDHFSVFESGLVAPFLYTA